MEETKIELQLIKLSEIQSQEVSWLWFPFIPYGKLTIIQGDPGDGKTTFILNIAAKLSKGEGINGEMKLTEPLNVIYQSAEDEMVKHFCNTNPEKFMVYLYHGFVFQTVSCNRYSNVDVHGYTTHKNIQRLLHSKAHHL